MDAVRHPDSLLTAAQDGPGGSPPDVAAATPDGMFASLRFRDFRLLWISNLSANFAMQMQMVARGWLVYDMTKSAMALFWVMLSFMLPQFVFSLAGGVVADRVKKRTVMVVAQGLNAAATLVMATVILTGHVNFWWFIGGGLFNGTVLSFSMPARSAVIPEIVGRASLVNAIALQSMVFNISRILGPTLAGVIIAMFAAGNQTSAFGVAIIYYVICSMYLVSACCTASIHHAGAPMARRGNSPIQDIVEGLRYMRQEKLILGLMILGFAPMTFGFTASSLMPAFNHEVVGGGPTQLGLLQTAMGAGALCSSLLLARLGDVGRKGRTMYITGFVWAAALALFAFSSHLALALAVCALLGLCSSLFGNLSGTTMQLAMRPEVRGRVMSMMMMTQALMPLGVLPVSIATEHFGISPALAGAAIMLALSLAAVNWWFPDLKYVDKGHGDDIYMDRARPALAGALSGAAPPADSPVSAAASAGHR